MLAVDVASLELGGTQLMQELNLIAGQLKEPSDAKALRRTDLAKLPKEYSQAFRLSDTPHL